MKNNRKWICEHFNYKLSKTKHRNKKKSKNTNKNPKLNCKYCTRICTLLLFIFNLRDNGIISKC